MISFFLFPSRLTSPFFQRLNTWLEDGRTLASYNLQDKEPLHFRRRPKDGSASSRQSGSGIVFPRSGSHLASSTPTPILFASASGPLRPQLTGSQISLSTSDLHAGSQSARNPSPMNRPPPLDRTNNNGSPSAVDKQAYEKVQAELVAAQKEIQTQAEAMKLMTREMAELRSRLAAVEEERDELKNKLQQNEAAARNNATNNTTPQPSPTPTPLPSSASSLPAASIPPPPTLTAASAAAVAKSAAVARAPLPETRVLRAESGRGPALPRPLFLNRPEGSPAARVMPPPSAAPPPIAIPPPPIFTTAPALAAMPPSSPPPSSVLGVHPALAASLDALLQAAAQEISAARGTPVTATEIAGWKTSLGRLVRSAETLARLCASPGWAEIKISDDEKAVIKRRADEVRRDAPPTS